MKILPKPILTLLAIGLAALSPPVQAAPITGRIDFGVGTVSYDTTSLATAKQVSTWTNAHVTAATGDFAAAQTTSPGSPGDSVSLAQPWIFNPSTPTPGLWSVDGFTFNLTTSVVVTQNANFLDITGAGMITNSNFDNTPGVWSFTSTDANGQPRNSFTFTTDTTAVPEAGTTVTLLFGLALIAGGKKLKKVALFRLRHKATA